MSIGLRIANKEISRLKASNVELLEATKHALEEMRHTTAPRNSFTDVVDELDAVIAKATTS